MRRGEMMSMHIWLRNGFPVFLILGLWLKPPCRLSIAVLNELAFAAAYLAVSIALVGLYTNVRRRYGDQLVSKPVVNGPTSALSEGH
jgi:hypothetical protein